MRGSFHPILSPHTKFRTLPEDLDLQGLFAKQTLHFADLLLQGPMVGSGHDLLARRRGGTKIGLANIVYNVSLRREPPAWILEIAVGVLSSGTAGWSVHYGDHGHQSACWTQGVV